MKYLWYKTIRSYVHIGLLFYFRKIKVFGHESIPKDKPILFVANHRNGLIDPILIATAPLQILHFLTRASAFKNPIADFLLRSINMLPVYRIRDGKDSIAKNQEIFEACYEIFAKGESVLIFPEGNHGLPRRVRPLSKGFTRIAYGFLDKYPDKALYIVPIGLNYTNILRPFRDVSLYYGKAFLANDYYNPSDENQAIDTLKNKVYEDLKVLTTHIENLDQHDVIENILKEEKVDFLVPNATNARIQQLEQNPQEIENHKVKKFSKRSKNIWQSFISVVFVVNTIFPILIWLFIKSKVKDVVMLSTSRFGTSVALIPFFYLIQAGIVTWFFGWLWGLLYFVLSLVWALMRKYIH